MSKPIVDFGLTERDKIALRVIVNQLSELRARMDARSVELLKRNADIIGSNQAADRVADCEIILSELLEVDND